MSLRENDPMEEFPHVVPVTVRNAALLLRQAVQEETLHKSEVDMLESQLKIARGKYREAEYLRKAADHRLRLSAMQPNGGEA